MFYWALFQFFTYFSIFTSFFDCIFLSCLLAGTKVFPLKQKSLFNLIDSTIYQLLIFFAIFFSTLSLIVSFDLSVCSIILLIAAYDPFFLSFFNSYSSFLYSMIIIISSYKLILVGLCLLMVDKFFSKKLFMISSVSSSIFSRKDSKCVFLWGLSLLA